MLGEQTNTPNVLSRRRRVVGSVAAFLALTLSGCSAGAGSFQDAINKANSRPHATADAPTEFLYAPTTEPATQPEPAHIDTTTSSPSAESTQATSEGTGSVGVPSGQTESFPEVVAPMDHLPQEERAMLAELAEIAGLASPDVNLYVSERFSTDVADYVLVSVEAAKPIISSEQLKQLVAKAETITAKKTSFSSDIALSPNTTTKVTYDVKPSDQISPSKKDTHYIFTGDSHAALHRLIRPYDASSLGDSAFSLQLPYKDLYLSFIARHSPGTLRDGVPADISDIVVEIFQTSGRIILSEGSEVSLDKLRPDMSNIKLTNSTELSDGQKYQAQKGIIAEAGQEVWANSYGFAVAARSAGMGYQEYRSRASEIYMRSNKLKPLQAFYIILGQAQYDSLPVLSGAR